MPLHQKLISFLAVCPCVVGWSVELQKPISNPAINATNLTAAFQAKPMQPLPPTANLDDRHWGALLCMANQLAHNPQDAQQVSEIVQWIHAWTYTITLADEPLELRRALPNQLNRLRHSATEVDRALNAQATSRSAPAVQRLLTEISKTLRLDRARYPKWRRTEQAVLSGAASPSLCVLPSS